MGPAFLIPAAIAAVGGIAGGINNAQATKRANAVELQDMNTQNMYRNKALTGVNQQTNAIANSNPRQLQQNEESQMVNTLRKDVGSGATDSSGNPTSALGPVAGASSRYKSGVNAANTDVQNFGQTQAGQKSAVDAAITQRQNEGLAMNTLATTLNGLNQQSYSQAFVDKLRAQAAGTPNPWVNMFSNVMQGGGQAAAKNGWFTGNGGDTTTTVPFAGDA